MKAMAKTSFFPLSELEKKQDNRGAKRFFFTGEEDVFLEVINPYDKETLLKKPVIDISTTGVSIKSPVRSDLYAPGTQFDDMKILVNGEIYNTSNGHVVYSRKFLDLQGKYYYQIGFQFETPVSQGIKMNTLKQSEKIFINRSLNMASIKSIGFDMDHTVARYHREAFETLAFRKTLEKFIAAGYPKELESLSFDPNFVIRGLLVDMDRGNLLKVDGHKYVKVAYHGHSKLSKEERHKLYNSKGYKADEFLSIDTFFALSEVKLFTEIVDYMRRFPGSISKSYREVYADLREFIDLSHRDGSIKDEVLNHIEKYIVRDSGLSATLIKLIEGGKKLFLLTNSDWTYTNAVMSFLLNGESEEYPKWKDYFEFNIVSSGKPNFFTGSNPFYEIVNDEGHLKMHSGSLIERGTYHGGNAKLLKS